MYVLKQPSHDATMTEKYVRWRFLADAVDKFGHDHEFTKLVVDLKGKDPDDAFSTIPYEKVRFHLSN